MIILGISIPITKTPFLLFSELLNLIDLIISFQEFNKRDLSSGNYLRSDIAVLKNLIEVVKVMDSWRKQIQRGPKDKKMPTGTYIHNSCSLFKKLKVFTLQLKFEDLPLDSILY